MPFLSYRYRTPRRLGIYGPQGILFQEAGEGVAVHVEGFCHFSLRDASPEEAVDVLVFPGEFAFSRVVPASFGSAEPHTFLLPQGQELVPMNLTDNWIYN